MELIFGVIIGLLVMTALVTAHEFGHFIAAKRNGVKVNEFGIGFPPRGIAWLHVKTKETKKNGKPKWKWERLPKKDWDKEHKTLVFSLNLLPIGGFCAMDGESDADTKKGTFGAASYWSKTKILFAGVTANWLVAWIVFTILALVGMPKAFNGQFFIDSDVRIEGSPVQVAEVLDDTPAKTAGIKSEDLLKSACVLEKETCKNGTKVDIFDTYNVMEFNDAHRGELVRYVIERDGKDQDIDLTLGTDGYALGISMQDTSTAKYYTTWSAPIIGATTTIQLTGETYRGIWNMLVGLVKGVANQFSAEESVREAGKAEIGKAGDSVTGPIGIIGVIFPNIVAGGPIYVMFIAAIISLSLACMNVLPIPALDGGRWLLITIWRLRGKKLDKDTEAKIVSRAFIVLIALMILITILDITKIIR